MKTYPLENIITVSKAVIIFKDENNKEHSIIPKQCCRFWRKTYLKNDMFAWFKRNSYRYIGNRTWNIGEESVITFFTHDEIRFVLKTPKNISSAAYLDARNQWRTVLAQIQDAGWWLFDCN